MASDHFFLILYWCFIVNFANGSQLECEHILDLQVLAVYLENIILLDLVTLRLSVVEGVIPEQVFADVILLLK